MRVCIVGTNPELNKHCRALLEELTSGGWELVAAANQLSPPEADVYLWDLLPESYAGRLTTEIVSRSLFAVELKDLEQFHQLLGSRRASILLKPVKPAALRPFLEHAIRQNQAPGGLRRSDPGSVPGEARNDEAEALLECLLHANLALQQYDQQRTNFLARAVHDFRAPLTALSGYCGLLIDQRLGALSHDQIDLLSRMQHSIMRLSRLTDAMFELSVGQRLNREPELQTGDVEAVVSHAIHEITPHADGKQIRIAAQLNPPAQPLMFDPAKIEQVLVNLLDNACKFTSKNGTIEISGYSVHWNNAALYPPAAASSGKRPLSSSAPNAYRIDIRDSGCGIPLEHIESIFEEFTSYSGGADRSGGGLGLAICRMIVNAHQGRIWAESRPEGAQFSLILLFPTPLRRRVGVEIDTRKVSNVLSA
jgi:signal transduction histidine kinase